MNKPCPMFQTRTPDGECSINLGSVFSAPSVALGLGENQGYSMGVNIAVWGGLIYLLFMRGK